MLFGGRTIRRTRRSRSLACGLVVLMLSALAAAADAAPAGKYKGNTSQGRPISFRLAQNQATGLMITGLKFQIKATCPSRRVWIVTATGFAPIKIVQSQFAATFHSRTPSATATVKGRILAKKVTGSLTMKRFIGQEHAFCSGKATFSLHR
jgi:hypothetical protein